MTTRHRSTRKPGMRSCVSLTLTLSGIAVLLTSLVLLIGPPTHVAHFSGWQFSGLNKCQWNAVHVMTGLLFLVVSLFHLFLNWRPVLSYFRFSGWPHARWATPFLLSCLLTLYVGAGALTGLPPMQQLITWLRTTKAGYVRIYGVPPYGAAEKASLRHIAGYMGWHLETCLENMKKNGLSLASADQPFREIAAHNGISPERLMESMRNRDTALQGPQERPAENAAAFSGKASFQQPDSRSAEAP